MTRNKSNTKEKYEAKSIENDWKQSIIINTVKEGSVPSTTSVQGHMHDIFSGTYGYEKGDT